MTARSIGLWLAVAALVGCGPEPDRSAIYLEDFEETCEGIPCGWVQSSGPDGAARYIETLPGDHGLELEGDGVSVRSDASEMLRGGVLTGAIAVRMTARCDATANLDLRATLELSDGRTLTVGRSLAPEVTWSSAPMDVQLEPVDAVPQPWAVTRVFGVSLLKNGAGSCEVDSITLRTLDATLPD